MPRGYPWVAKATGRFASLCVVVAPGTPLQPVRWVADVFARLFLTYISMPPADPNFGVDAELRRFAHQVLTPMVGRAGQTGMA